MRAFIHSTVLISPQPTFTGGLPGEWVNYAEAFQLRCIEPAYREFLDPMASRRMSRIVKMAVCAALQSLKIAGIPMPDGIIAGTGLGCLEDTGKFLASIYANAEKLLNPTPFIQSTHNTVAGAVALALKCHGYNATYSQRGFSFDSALYDALDQVGQKSGSHFLVCSFDEITEASNAITHRMGLWKTEPVDSLSLLQKKGRGSLPGEGAAFFVMGGSKSEGAVCFEGMQTLFRPENGGEVEAATAELLKEASLEITDLDLVLLGLNGNERHEDYYRELMNGIFANIPQGGFKHLCGEYDTAASFAVGLASEIIRTGRIPDGIVHRGTPNGKPRTILVYNHLNGIYHSLYLLRAC